MKKSTTNQKDEQFFELGIFVYKAFTTTDYLFLYSYLYLDENYNNYRKFLEETERENTFLLNYFGLPICKIARRKSTCNYAKFLNEYAGNKRYFVSRLFEVFEYKKIFILHVNDNTYIIAHYAINNPNDEENGKYLVFDLKNKEYPNIEKVSDIKLKEQRIEGLDIDLGGNLNEPLEIAPKLLKELKSKDLFKDKLIYSYPKEFKKLNNKLKKKILL